MSRYLSNVPILLSQNIATLYIIVRPFVKRMASSSGAVVAVTLCEGG
jgi:hypothetical protein